MKKGKLIGLLLLSILIVSACKGYEITEVEPEEETTDIILEEEIENETEAAEEESTAETSEEEVIETTEEETEFELFNPTLKYANLYNGPLYLAGMDWNTSILGEEEMFTNLDKNGINYMLIFVTPGSNLEIIKSAIENHPSQISIFTNPKLTTTELRTSFTDDSIPSKYEDAFNDAKKELGAIKGIGRWDISSLGISPTNSKIIEIYDFAEKEDATIILEIGKGEAQRDAFQELVTSYKNTKFILHIDPEEFQEYEKEYTDLLVLNENLFYIIDLNDILYEGQLGLLEKFSSKKTEEAITDFITEYDTNSPIYINNGVSRYDSLIAGYPEKIILGTYLPLEYDYDEEVYNRIIKASRTFIINLDEEYREKIAYKNSLEIFGEGI